MKPVSLQEHGDLLPSTCQYGGSSVSQQPLWQDGDAVATGLNTEILQVAIDRPQDLCPCTQRHPGSRDKGCGVAMS